MSYTIKLSNWFRCCCNNETHTDHPMHSLHWHNFKYIDWTLVHCHDWKIGRTASLQVSSHLTLRNASRFWRNSSNSLNSLGKPWSSFCYEIKTAIGYKSNFSSVGSTQTSSWDLTTLPGPQSNQADWGPVCVMVTPQFGTPATPMLFFYMWLAKFSWFLSCWPKKIATKMLFSWP